ncbi:MAG: hypothetical protein Q8Q42_03195 [Nanoarchaeota archaeon]|nr:hypothetical protein [Nanoarchaeota archaeon]
MKKRGQISIEIMYSVGVLLVIFILTSSLAFNRKLDIERAGDTVSKRSDCAMISNAINRVVTLGEGHKSTFKTVYNFDVYDIGLIIVGDEPGTSPGELEVICTYNGKLNQSNYTDGQGIWQVSVSNYTEIVMDQLSI